MIVAVTGGAGFIGSHLVEELVKRGYDVRVIDDLSHGSLGNLSNVLGDIDFCRGDVRKIEDLKPVLKGADAVIHEAALTSVPESFEEEALYSEINVLGTENVLKLAKEYGLKVILASSCAIYGEPNEVPIKEMHPPNPSSPYAWTKYRMEQICEYYNAAFNVDAVILRYFNVYGRRQRKGTVVSQFIRRAAENQPLIIYGDGNQTRDFIHVGDAVDATIRAMENDKVNGRIFNIGTGKAITINELAKLILEVFEKDDLPLIYGPNRKGDIRRSVADITLARKILGFEPKRSLREFIKEYSECL